MRQRLLLLETEHDILYQHHRAEYFPFLLALARRQGWDARWWRLRVPEKYMHGGARFMVDLPPERRALLARRLKAWAPDAVVFHDRPAPELCGFLRRALPQARLADLTRCAPWPSAPRRGRAGAGSAPEPAAESAPINTGVTVGQILALLSGGPEPSGARARELLLDAVRPCFQRRFLAHKGESPVRQPWRLIVDSCCSYRRPLRGNRFYRKLGAALARDYVGCAFCMKAWYSQRSHAASRPRTPPVELVLRQVAAHQKGAADRKGRFEYIFEDSPFHPRIDRFFAEVLARRLKPSVFYTMMRADMLLALRPRLEALLPRLSAAGHGLRLLSIGAENFSDEENERLNKGVSAQQLWDCYDMLRDWEKRFPGAFAWADKGCFAAILFTPWTRPADLLLNLKAARRLGFEWLLRAVGTRLQLRRLAPITALARRDRLLGDWRGSCADIAATCLVSPEQVELPWRFQDPRTELIHRLLVRLDPIPEQASVPKDDPLAQELRRRRALLPKEAARDYIGLAFSIVEAVAALGPKATARQVLSRCFPKAGRAAPRPEPRPAAKKTAPAAARPAPAPRPAPAAAPAASGPGELTFSVADREQAGVRYRFHVARWREGSPYFERAGDTALWYSHPDMTPGALLFASLLLAVMKTLPAPSAESDATRWRAALAELLARTGVGPRFAWTADWTHDRGDAPAAR